MKILLFTHEQDIDGMGSIIIASQAFSSFDYITCQTFEVNQKVKETIDNGKIYDYDFIYVTDICINNIKSLNIIFANIDCMCTINKTLNEHRHKRLCFFI